MDGDEEVKGEIDSCERRNVLVVDHVAVENVDGFGWFDVVVD